MHQSNLYRYEVISGETISVRVESFGGPFLALAQLDNKQIKLRSEALQPTPGVAEFSFTIDRSPGSTYFLLFVFSFLPNPAPDAKYEVELKNSDGPPYQFSVTHDAVVQTISLQFHVITGEAGIVDPPEAWL